MKIPDIKNVRVMTQFLGKLGLPSCVVVNPWFKAYYPVSVSNREYYFGLGLKDAKDYVESKYIYDLNPIDASYPLRQIEYGNQIQQIKTTRQFMAVLNKCGIRSADYGLRVCKEYVDRRRARR